jgi:hypothetical protein
MTRQDAIKMIDAHKNKLINPVEMLNWTWLRVIILKLDDKEWERALTETVKALSR